MKGFSDEERDRIRQDLFETGRTLFARYGLDKTTIAELTDPVGIANSTFYQFFDSKEHLYFEIMEAEGQRVAHRIVENSLEVEDDTRDAIASFLSLLLEEIETNELFHRIVVDDDFGRVLRHIDHDRLEQSQAESLMFVLPYIEQWQAAGDVRGDDPVLVGYVMGLVKLITMWEAEIGEERYDAVRDLLIETVADGLTCTDE